MTVRKFRILSDSDATILLLESKAEAVPTTCGRIRSANKSSVQNPYIQRRGVDHRAVAKSTYTLSLSP